VALVFDTVPALVMQPFIKQIAGAIPGYQSICCVAIALWCN